jgi:hypothetical protein
MKNPHQLTAGCEWPLHGRHFSTVTGRSWPDPGLHTSTRNGHGSHGCHGRAVGVGREIDALDAGVRQQALAVASAGHVGRGRSVVAGEAGIVEVLCGSDERHTGGNVLGDDGLKAGVVSRTHAGAS